MRFGSAFAVLHTLGDNALTVPADYPDARPVMGWARTLVVPTRVEGPQRYLGVIQMAARGDAPLLVECPPEQLDDWVALWRQVKGAAA
jgi:hypothetical protein